MDSRSRQAGADDQLTVRVTENEHTYETREPDVAITAEMLEAGMEAFWADDVEEVGSKVIVAKIYTAMVEASLKDGDDAGNLSD